MEHRSVMLHAVGQVLLCMLGLLSLKRMRNISEMMKTISIMVQN